MATADAGIDWAPEVGLYRAFVHLLEATSSPDYNTQRRVNDEVERLQADVPDYAAYLMYAFAQALAPASSSPNTCAIAGIMLKNYLNDHYAAVPPPVLAYVRTAIFPVLAAPLDAIRRAAVGVLTTLLALGRESWPQGFAKLIQIMNSDNPDEMEAAFAAFTYLTEDVPLALENLSIDGAKPIDVLVPGWIQAATYTEKRVRVLALKSLNEMARLPSQALMTHIDSFIAALFVLATDEDPQVRRQVCKAFIHIMSLRSDKLESHLDGLIEYMLYSMQDTSPEVNLEAAEFWLSLVETETANARLQPYLPRLVPALLKGMVYSDDDVILLGSAEDDAHVPDRPEDIAPRHVGAGGHTNQHVEEPSTTQGRSTAAIDARFDDEEEEEDWSDDEDFDDEDGGQSWNTRKACAATLDVLAVSFGDVLLEPLLPLLRERLFSEDWLQREVAILALGAVAEGAFTGITPHLPTLTPLLLQSLSDTKSLVRSITCWTLGRYSKWYVGDQSPEHLAAYFAPVLDGLLRMALDKVKRVQEAGCSAFATLEEEAANVIVPYLPHIVPVLAQAFKTYQRKNMLVLYDAITTMSDAAGAELNRPEFAQGLLPLLVERYNQLDNANNDLIPLVECFSAVATAMGTGFAPYAPLLWSRSLDHTSDIIARCQSGEVDLEWDDERDFLVAYLDIFSALLQGLQTQAQSLMGDSAQNLMSLVLLSLQLPDILVRQSAYALLGDLAIFAFPQLTPSLPYVLPEIVRQIEVAAQPEEVQVCNNAVWAMGEIALQTNSAELKPWIPPLVQRLVPLLLGRANKSLTENAAVTLGRLGLVVPEDVAPHLELFSEAWCTSLWDIRDNDEKDSAFRGFCRMVELNPNAMHKSFGYFCMAIVRWQTPSKELNEQFVRILSGFKQIMGPEAWASELAKYPPLIADRLSHRYGL